MTSIIYLFPDTNFFVKCEALKIIDWRICEELADVDEIHMLVCLPALQEIDNLKYRSDSVGRRANKVYKILRRLITGEATYHTISNEEPIVRLHEETRVRPEPGLLDYETPDERIVGCAHAYQIAHPDRDVRFLTHDAGAMAIARNANVPLVMVPDQWRKEPPPSAAELKVVELEAKIKRQQQTEPRFDIQFGGPEGETLDKIEGDCIAARSLTDSEVSQLLSQLQSRFPRSSTSEWLEDCERVLRNLHTSIQHQSERLSVKIAIQNRGTLPAKDALIEIVGHGPILLGVPFDDDDFLRKYRQEPIRLPSPPSTFYRRMFQSTIRVPLDYSKLPPRDPNTLYYKPERPSNPAPSIQLECQQWRHGTGVHYLEFEIYFDSEEPIVRGAVECRIHAENLSSPTTSTFGVQCPVQTVDIVEKATQLVEQVAVRGGEEPDKFIISPY